MLNERRDFAGCGQQGSYVGGKLAAYAFGFAYSVRRDSNVLRMGVRRRERKPPQLLSRGADNVADQFRAFREPCRGLLGDDRYVVLNLK